MARKPAEGRPRRQPSGPKGEAIVKAVLEATRKVLVADGFDAATTNRIAEEAGVSIGSFYQYFPNKEAVIAEMARDIERRTDEIAKTRLVSAMSAARSEDELVAAADSLIDVVLGDELGETELRRVLQQRVPRAWVRAESSETDASVRSMVRDYLVAREDRIDPDVDPEIAAFVLVTAVEAVAEALIAQDPPEFDADALRAALRRLVLRYVTRA